MRITQALRHASAVLACLTAGCHLIDQRDFDARAGRRPVARMAFRAPPPAPALLTIRYTTSAPLYGEAVAAVVQQALARKRDVLFTVTTLIPDAGTADMQAAQAQDAAAAGRDVARTIVDSGAAAAQVEQSVRVQPGLGVKEVLVSVH